MLGVDPEVISHKLGVDPKAEPIAQKQRKLAQKRRIAICVKVDKLLEANAVREVRYPEWLSNTVVVPKKDKKWRVCVDFTDLNKACPKDSFPLPKIDQLVDSTTGHERMIFLDSYRGYHQIAMEEADQEKTTFITLKGTYCYKMMPFGFKNAGATYQRLVMKIFLDEIGKKVEAYIDDMVVKSKAKAMHEEDLRSVFDTMWRYKLKLNTSKFSFGVSSGKFLGYIVTQKGIEANPD